MEVKDDPIEQIIPTVQSQCLQSGGCTVYVTRERGQPYRLYIGMGDEELCYFSSEHDAEYIRTKLKKVLKHD